MTIGKGYDRFRGTARGRCVIYDKVGPQPTTGEQVRFELRSVENEASLYRKLGVSVSAKYGTVSAKGGYEKETSINSYSAFFFISAEIDVRGESVTKAGMEKPVLEPDDLALLTSNFQRFKEKCGDTFISSQVLGGKYIALVEIKTKSSKDLDSVRAAISGSAGPMNLSVGAQSRLEQLTKDREMHVTVIRGGGDGAVIPTSPKGLAEAVTKYPDSLRGLPRNKLQPSVVTVEEYTTLAIPPEIRRADFDYSEKQEFIEEADAFVSKHRDAIANAKYALANVDEFPNPLNKAELELYVQHGETITRDVANQVRACLQGMVQCKDFEAPVLNIVNPPSRLDGPTRAELEALTERSRAALDSIVLVSNDNLKKICIKITPAPMAGRGGNEWAGCIMAYQYIAKECSKAGCRP